MLFLMVIKHSFSRFSFCFLSVSRHAIHPLINIFSLVKKKTVAREQPFKDKVFLYRFCKDEDGSGVVPTSDDVNNSNEHIKEGLTSLLRRGPDATLRLILRKP